MAKVEDTKHLYEVLIRFNEKSEFQGAHAQYIEVLKIDGVVRNATVGEAVPLSQADLSEIMNEAQSAAMTAASTALVEIKDRDNEISRLNGAIGERDKLVDEMQQRFDNLVSQMQTERQRLADEAAQMQEAIAERDGVLQQLQAALTEATNTVNTLEARMSELETPKSDE